MRVRGAFTAFHDERVEPVVHELLRAAGFTRDAHVRPHERPVPLLATSGTAEAPRGYGLFMNHEDRIALLERAYERFNARQVDDLFAIMAGEVEWPDVANGAVLRGKDAIRPYWEGQFAVANPQVTPTEFIPAGEDVVAVIDQQVLSLEGEPLIPRSTVFHRYTFDGDLVCRMVVFTDRAEAVRGS